MSKSTGLPSQKVVEKTTHLRKRTLATQRIKTPNAEVVDQLLTTIDDAHKLKHEMRPTHTDDLTKAVVMKVEVVAAYIQTNAEVDGWICENAASLRDLITKASALGQVPSGELAIDRLTLLQTAGVKVESSRKLKIHSTEVLQHLKEEVVVSVFDIHDNFISDLSRCGVDEFSVGTSSEAHDSVVALLEALLDKVASLAKPGVPVSMTALNALKLNKMYNYFVSVASCVPSDFAIPMKEKLDWLPKLADYMSSVTDYLQLGPDEVTRSHRDETLGKAKAMVHAVENVQVLHETFGDKVPGFVQMLQDEANQVKRDAEQYMVGSSVGVFAARAKLLEPLSKIAPFIDPTMSHWTEDYDGDGTVADISRFMDAAFFTLDPDKFHYALKAASDAASRIDVVLSTFKTERPESCKAHFDILRAAKVCDYEGELMGTISECADNTIRLKRSLIKKYEQVAPKVWDGVHPTIQNIVEAFFATLPKGRQT